MVRYAKKQELAIVNELRKQVNDLHAAGRPDIFRKEFCKELQDYIYEAWEDEKTDIIVAVKDDHVCGYALVEYIIKPMSPYTRERRYCHLSEFGVEKTYHRQKIGTDLIAFVKKEAKQKNFNRIELDMWEFNENALKFYESVGFGTYRRYMEYKNCL